MKTVKYQPANKFWKGNWKWAKFMHLLRDGKWRRWSRRRGRSRGWRRGYTGRGCSTKPHRAVSYHDPSSRPALPILERLQSTKFLNCYLFFPFLSLVWFGSSYSGRKGKETAFCRVLETSDGSLGEREREVEGERKRKRERERKSGLGGLLALRPWRWGREGRPHSISGFVVSAVRVGLYAVVKVSVYLQSGAARPVSENTEPPITSRHFITVQGVSSHFAYVQKDIYMLASIFFCWFREGVVYR